MRNLVVAIALSLLAIIMGFTSKEPGTQGCASPAALAQARSAIAELPLPPSAKETYYARIERTPEAHLPYLVEEARRVVDLSTAPAREARLTSSLR